MSLLTDLALSFLANSDRDGERSVTLWQQRLESLELFDLGGAGLLV